jgi:site-specific recombinase XerD
MPAAGADRTPELQKEMRNSRNVWTDPGNAKYPLSQLRDGYEVYVATRSKPIAAGTQQRYMYDLKSFEASLVLNREPLMLDSLNPFNVDRWLLDMREGRVGRKGLKLGEETISSRLSSIKTFSRKYIYRHLELTNRDLLDKVERFDPPERRKAGLTDSQLEQVVTCYDQSERYTDVRDRAMVLMYAASALRFSAVLRLRLDDVDRYAGWIKTIDKGGRERIVRVGDRVLKALRRYLHVRRAQEGVDEILTTEEGTAFTYQGGQRIFRRLKQASELPWLHCHRFRHTWAQGRCAKRPIALWCKTRWAGRATAWRGDTKVGCARRPPPRRCQRWRPSSHKKVDDLSERRLVTSVRNPSGRATTF